ncbi:MAG TPA: hypothetical protein VGM91_12305 [Conexibacter sp.]
MRGYHTTMEMEPESGNLAELVAGLTGVVDKLIGIVSRLDDETSDTAAANFGSDAPRVAGHKATAEELKRLSDTLGALQRSSGSGTAD